MPINGYFDELFAIDGSLATVPDAPQGNGSVSYNQGYGILYSTPVGSGGFNFPRSQHNQILYDITAAIQNQQQNTIAPFITTAMNGGAPFTYPAGPMVFYGGVVYQSLVASNADTPPSAKWKTINVNAAQSITGATHTYAAADSFLLTNRSNSGTLMIDTLPGTPLGNYWQSDIANTDSSALLQLIVGGGANLNGSSTGNVILGPGQRISVICDGTNYFTRNSIARTRLGASTTFYVDHAAGNDANNGLASGTAWATITRALTVLSQNYDLNNQSVIVQLADSASYVNSGCTTPWVGGSPLNVTINGNSGTPSNVIVAGLFANNMNTGFNVSNLKLMNGGGAGINAGVGSEINLGTGIVFGACSTAHINAQDGANVNINNNYTINGASPIHYNSSISSIIAIGNITCTISGTPAFSTAFSQSATCGGIFANSGLTFSGSATGVRYLASINGWMATQSGGANFFPGNSAGSVASGGQYT